MFTKKHLPVELVYYEQFQRIIDAFHREHQVKGWNRKKKEALIKKAKILLANSEFSEEEIAKVKELRNEYKAIGFAGKDKDDDLYQRFNEVIQKYFDEMKFYKD